MNMESLVQRIVWGGTYAFVKDGLGYTKRIIFRSPSLRNKQLIDHIYQQAVLEAKEDGCIGLAELTVDLQKRGFWGKKQEDRIEFLKSTLVDIEDKLEGANLRQRRVLESSQQRYGAELFELLELRHSYFQFCAEKQAESVRTGAIIYASTFNESDELYWPTYQDYLDEQDDKFVKNLISAINETEKLTNKQIRAAARSSYWRMQWSAGKSVGDLFGRPIIELDAEQSALVYWSQVYDYVYEHPDKPSDDVIKNDKALDEWFENEDRKKKVSEVSQGGNIGGTKLSSNISRHGEVFIVANPAINPNAPTTQSIEELNDSMTRKFKSLESKRLKQKKTLRETELRDRKNKIARRIIGSSDAVLSKKSGLGGSSRHSQAKRFPGGTIG